MNIDDIKLAEPLIAELKSLEKLFRCKYNGHETTIVKARKYKYFSVRDYDKDIEINSKYFYEAVEKQIKDKRNELIMLGVSL